MVDDAQRPPFLLGGVLPVHVALYQLQYGISLPLDFDGAGAELSFYVLLNLLLTLRQH